MNTLSNKMNVSFFGCWPSPYGGIASHLNQLLPDLVSAGLNVSLCINNETGRPLRIKDRGVDIYYYTHKYIFKKYFFKVTFLFLRLFHLKKDLTLREFVIQICHCIQLSDVIIVNDVHYLFTHDSPRHLVVPLIRARFPKLKIFATIYADFLIDPLRYNVKKKYLKSCFSSSDLILSCSHFCCNLGTEFLKIKYPMKVIYNNVDPNLYSPNNNGDEIRAKYNISRDSIVLLTMCKMTEEMGIKFLIDIHDQILGIDPKLVIFFVGASNILSSQIYELSQSNTRIFHSFDISNEFKHLYFAASDIFTAPTLGSHACMGIANIEAMMSGVPVLSSNSGGHRETIDHGHDGFIVPLEDGKINKDLYLSYLNELVKNSDLRSKIALRTRVRALSLFSNDRIVEEHINVMKGIF